MKIDKRHLLNYSILLPYLILSVIGLIMVYSTTSVSLIQAQANPFRSVANQGLFWVVSLVAITFIYKLKLNFLTNTKVLTIVMLLEILLLIAARFFTTAINGAHGWIVLGPLRFQPAEYLKIIMVWYLALTFSKMQEKIHQYDYQALTRRKWWPTEWGDLRDWRVYSLIMIVLVAAQPDLGNASIIVLTAIIMFLVSGIGYRWFSAILVLITGLSTAFLGMIAVIGVEKVAKIPVFGYVAKRFSAFFNPFRDLTDSGHQLANSYYAMSNGGWFGRGLGNSIEKRGYLPEAQTDFVFSVVIEELGLIGAGLILALVFFLILRIMNVGIKAKNPFNAMMALGVGGMMLMQVFVNIGGISGLIPSTGVTFPFLSQGGNSLLVLSVGVGFVLNIDANEKKEDILKEAELSYRKSVREENSNSKIININQFQ
ncbi:cell division peptidoglycan polymerase FtsW [Streptococcus equi]|uniref:Probable peptidoglycan glycosyltransferase FtsW n=1 Tax=Streptococcus equi subsp. equi (strain 4047) TaxID=553482 RepID=C0MAY2_STRE4|nr:FtsW/RodA/SpoVE family cell cycle protein [Streptococcus equi]ASB96390.1 cell division protein [Streptococcus equi subsp. equi]MBT1195018.1 FtsW/RodA/SpoVE family cell cycle protein [Streptococcus equi subsp. equi]MBT1197747.1 FtsW/RodA/SpoVE family cell cycle protein [Streptococcus equi subsp. equi]MBT1198684.1 FtsW/RodA/SpoVE family cell cycle protein [Streptococcus equi subsp. equi]MBT1200294.1 FtsW/RodA/SpoVE family cell cycle protein [Streptococcus equi subsp. equi]